MNKKLVITGVFDSCSDWDQLSELLKWLGGHVTNSVSGQTDILLIGKILEDGWPVQESNKYKQAVQKWIQMLNETQLNELLIEQTGTTLEEWIRNVHKEIFEQKNKEKIKLLKSLQNCQKIKAQQNEVNQLWVDKYKPLFTAQMIGSQENILKVKHWLEQWGDKKNSGLARQKEKSKCLLISGPPGIGKTTAIKLISQEQNYNLIVQNASDNWSKNSIQEFMQCFQNRNLSLENFFAKSSTNKTTQKTVLLMDEIDGITSDRGGLTELLQQIKVTHQPIICICNDWDKQQIKTLSQYCYDLKFKAPNFEEILVYLECIIKQEVSERAWERLNKQSLRSIIENSNFDIRQILSQVQIWVQSSNDKVNDNSTLLYSKDTDLSLSVFDACKKLLNSKKTHLQKPKELMRLFFVDYQLMDFYVFENYLSRVVERQNELQKAYQAIRSICQGEKASLIIAQTQWYDLLPVLAWQSVISPCLSLNRHLDFPQFPIQLGKMSAKNKKLRQYQQISNLFYSQVGQTVYLDMVLICMTVLGLFGWYLKKGEFQETYKMYRAFNLDSVMTNEELPNFVEFFDDSNIVSQIDKKSTKNFEKTLSQQTTGKNTKGIKTKQSVQSIQDIQELKDDMEQEEIQEEVEQEISDYDF